MSKRRVKYKHGWTLIDENIENVERVKLNPEMQRELGCLVGEHVFLEYPWAYVDRDVIAKFAKFPDSWLAPFREMIDIYEADTFLVGYSSTRLDSDDFVICLTEKAKRLIRERNKTITGIISRKVIGRVIKTAKSWNSLGSDIEVDENLVRNRREFFEIEILFPGKMLNSSRTLSNRGASDSRDSYIQLINEEGEKFEIIERKCISKGVQTSLQPRETFVQTCPTFPKNAWTQYVYEDILGETPVEEEKKQVDEETERNKDNRSEVKDIDQSNEDLEDEKPKEKTPLELFLETRSQEMIDAVKYNAAVNLYVDDIESLISKRESKISTIEVATLSEQVSFIDLSVTGNGAISDVSLHSKFKEHVAISYITISNRTLKTECLSEGEFQTRALVWKLNDPLRPHLVLQDHREIYSVSFCPYDDDYVIGGCSTGQVIIWNIKDYLNGISDNKTVKFRTTQNNLPILRPTVVSHKHHSHRLPIRKIRWIPAKCRIEPNGNLTRSSNISSNMEFLTVSEDGTAIVWNVCFRLVNQDSEDEPLHPIFRLKIPTFGENPSQSFTPLCFCLDERNENSSDRNESKSKDFRKYLWIGCAEGLIKCKWEEQVVYEENLTDIAECKILNCSYVHNGPVIEIVRSSHVRDVLLSIGGQVFAIWNDDHMDSPLFWRRTSARYTSCCWANEPGVFLLGSEDGNLEMWNINSESNQPIFTQVVSLKSVTCLILLPVSRNPEDAKMIGVGDHGGLFRAFEEPEICRGKNATRMERMDWFEEYAWRETRRKKLFASWQNDFLVNDPVIVARRSARRDEEREKKAEEAREKLRREQQTRLRLEAEKRARSAPVPKDVAWRSREFDRMKQVLLNKKRIVPSELEAKRTLFVATKAERDAKLEKVRNRIARRDEYFLNAISVEFPALSIESKTESSEFEKFTPIKLGKSTDDYVEKFNEIRRKAKEMLTNNFAS